MERVYSITVFKVRRTALTGVTGGVFDYRVNCQDLPEGAHVVCVMDDAGKQVFCGGLEATTHSHGTTMAEIIQAFTETVRSKHDPLFGRRVDPNSPTQEELELLRLTREVALEIKRDKETAGSASTGFEEFALFDLLGPIQVLAEGTWSASTTPTFERRRTA